MTLWCAGLPYAGDRTLTEEERRALETRIRVMNRVGICLLICLFPSVVVAVSLLRPLADRMPTSQSPASQIVVTSYLLFFVLLGTGIALQVYCGQKLLRHSYQLKSACKAGVLLVFQGVLTERLRLETTQNALLSNHRLQLDPHQIQTLELFAAIGVLWRVNGVEVRRWIRPVLKEVASPPSFAAIAAEWLEPVGKNEESILYGGKRELSENEKRELETFVRRLTTRPTTSSLPISLLSFGLAAHLYSSHAVEGDPMFWFFVTGGISNMLLYLFQIRQAMRFGDDLKVGYVGIRRIKATDASVLQDSEEPDIEFLPVTGMLWTKSGEPAVWRRGSA